MGNNASSDGKAGEWKGPFSDQVRVYAHVYIGSMCISLL